MEDAAKGLFSSEFFDKWYHNYHRLEALGKKGVTLTYRPDEELARWMDIQRRLRHMLPDELRSRLSALNFGFEDTCGSWGFMHRQLALFVEKHGHAFLPDEPGHEALKDWLNRQILNKRLLSGSQLQSLDRLGIAWDTAQSRDHRWEMMLLRLKEFHGFFAHCRVPQKWAKDRQLALWVTVQRRAHAKGSLREDRQRKLSELGFTWDIKTLFDTQWERYYYELAVFRRTHGHCQVPGKHPQLVSWIERQRISKKNGLLPAGRERRLNSLDFIWSCENIRKRGWEERFGQLSGYWKRHGHSFVPVNCSENKALGTWVASQRSLEAKGKLSAARKRKLDRLGFVWSRDTQRQLKSIYDAQWEVSFEKLKSYRKKHGSCQVSLKIDPILQRWTRWQRKLFHQSRLSPERIDRLNEIHFPWKVQEGYWIRMYVALTSFKNQFGHTRVPSQWEPNPQLARWVYRTKLSRPELTPQKAELLNEIGFDWSLRPKTVVTWEVMYGRLVKFRQKHGHTRVPVKWAGDPKLGKWASRMRSGKEKLAPERASLLEAIGFQWCRRREAENSAGVYAN